MGDTGVHGGLVVVPSVEKEMTDSNLIAELRDSCDCSGLSNPSGVCLKCRSADALEGLRAAVDEHIAINMRLTAELAEKKALLRFAGERIEELAGHKNHFEAERDRLAAELAEERQMHADVDAALKIEVDERDRLRVALERYGTHRALCAARGGYGFCSCGLSEALAGGAASAPDATAPPTPSDSTATGTSRTSPK